MKELLYLKDEQIKEFIEKLFLCYRDTFSDSKSVLNVSNQLSEEGLMPKVLVDCSHGNSIKNYRRHSDVLRAVAQQLKEGSSNIMGIMLESHLVEGNQKLSTNLEALIYGQSITDACIDFTTTETLLEELANTMR